MFSPARRLAAFGLALLSLAANGCSDAKQQTTAKAPVPNANIVLVVADALRQDVLGCYGGEARTPNIDKLAANGVLFENAYSTSPWTPPSAVSIFTGNYATSYPFSKVRRVVQAHVPDEELLLAEVLRDRGYDIAMRRGNHLIAMHNCLQGFEMLPDELMIRQDDKEAIDRIAGATIRDNFGYLNTYSILNRLLNMPHGHNFFLSQWIIDPHEPLTPPRKFMQKIAVDQSRLTQPKKAYARRNNIEGDLNEAEAEYLRARYIAEVESVDERIGYLMRMLEHRQLLDSTYFVFTSDHGELFGEHGRFGHGVNYYEELVKVPLVIAGPALPAGKRVRGAVSLVDLMPTLKDLLGLDYEDNMLGQSFKALVFDEAAQKGSIYFDDIREHDDLDALLAGGFKLVALRDGTHRLYDLSSDPGEAHDVAAGHKSTVDAMMQELLGIRDITTQRHASNLALTDSVATELSDEEAAELDKKLRALGYIR